MERSLSPAAVLAALLVTLGLVGLALAVPVLAQSGPVAGPMMPDMGATPDAPVKTSNDKERFMPESITWLNSAPLSTKSLRGKVVLVDFWTYSCINSLRNLAYVQSWAAKYKDAGLVVIGVHTPEFGFEKERSNVENALREYDVTYPVAIDSSYRIWQAFDNEYWPADYFIDGKGRIRHHHFGEGDYGESERIIQALLKENGAAGVRGGIVRVSAAGVKATPNWSDEATPETYLGYQHGIDQFTSPQPLGQDSIKTYTPTASPSLNQWGLSGSWNVAAESALLTTAPGKIVLKFHSRDVHLVLSPTVRGTPLRFRVTVDGAAPGRDHGTDTAADGAGEVREPRLYQLVRQMGNVRDRTFAIEFLDPGVRAYVFTFG